MNKIPYHKLPEEELDDLERVERMRPKSAREDQKNKKYRASFVLAEDKWKSVPLKNAFAARVVEVHKRYAFVSPEPEVGDIRTREVYLTTVARRYLQVQKLERNFIVVGDRVLCEPVDANVTGVTTDIPQAVIEHLSPRQMNITRPDPHKPTMTHVLAANVDQLIIVASYLAPKIRWGLVDRYLALADTQGLDVTVVLTKKDLLQESDDEELKDLCLRRQKILDDLGVPWVALSAQEKNAQNARERDFLASRLKGKISVFSGHSGVGKSSLVNLFNPELVQVVEPDENIFYKGRHTTSFASLIRIAGDGYVIDSPGIRSFLVEAKSPADLLQGFREMRPLLGQCRFSKCQHIQEEECAILQAVQDGLISRERYESYKNLWLGDSGREGMKSDIEGKVE